MCDKSYEVIVKYKIMKYISIKDLKKISSNLSNLLHFCTVFQCALYSKIDIPKS